MRNRLPINNFLMVTRHHTDGQYPRCHSLEMTIHILRDLGTTPGLLPLAFFHMPL